MGSFLLRRLLAGMVTVLLASLLLFSLMHLLPGDEARAVFPSTSVRVPPELYDQVLREMRLDRPFVVQYGLFLRDLVTLDLGRGLPSVTPGFLRVVPGDPIRPDVVSRLAISGGLLAGVLAMTVVLAPALAWVASLARRQDRGAAWRADRVGRAASVAMVAVPSLVAAILVQTAFSTWSDLVVTPRWASRVPAWQNWLPPILSLGTGIAAHVALVAREEVVLALGQPWARLASALGLPHRRIARHALRPAAGIAVHALGANIAAVSTGLVVVEDVFGVPGIGTGLLQAIRVQDRTTIVTMLVVVVALAVAASTVAEVVHAAVDPRVRDRVLVGSRA